MEGRAGGFGQLPGLLERPCASGVPDRSLEEARQLFGNDQLSHTLSSFINLRRTMNQSSSAPDFYPNRFVDMHTDAGFGIHSLILSSMTLAQRDALQDVPDLRACQLTLANGHVIPYNVFTPNAHNISSFSVQFPTRLGDLHNSFIPFYLPDSYIEDILFAQTLIVKQIAHMVVHPGIATQYAADIPVGSTFAPVLRCINHALDLTLPPEFDVYLSDNQLSAPITLGQIIYWHITQRKADTICEYRLMLAFLYEVSKLEPYNEGSKVRRLLECFRLWVNNGCSSCFLSELLSLPLGAPTYSPFNTSSVLDHPDKMYYIRPASYHVIQGPHQSSPAPCAPSYWVSYPMFEHTSLYVSASVGFSTLCAGNGSFSVQIPTHLIVTFDLIATKIVRIVRAAKAGRFFPLLHFFYDITYGFTTTTKLRDTIVCLKRVMELVPRMTSLIRNLITIIYCAALPRELTSTPWCSTRDINRESILLQIASATSLPNSELTTIVHAPVDSTEYLAILNSPSYANLLLNILRSEYYTYTDGLSN